MAQPTNNFKVGVFVIAAVASVIAIALALGTQTVQRQRVAFHTFFNESVQGLDVDSPVKFRGVTVGSVTSIAIAPDHRRVAVTEEINEDDLQHLGLERTSKGRLRVPPDLRAQLGSTGLTGGKYVALDYFDPATNPPPGLPFAVPDRYIPAAPSTMKTLEESVTRTMDKLPELVDALTAVTARVDGIAAQLAKDGVADKTTATLSSAQEVLTGLRATIRRADRARLPEKTSAALDGVSAAVAKMDRVLDRLDGNDGLIASARRTSAVVEGLGAGPGATTRQLEQTLREIRDAAASIRDLADEIERDPDMLLKGRARPSSGGR